MGGRSTKLSRDQQVWSPSGSKVLNDEGSGKKRVQRVGGGMRGREGGIEGDRINWAYHFYSP